VVLSPAHHSVRPIVGVRAIVDCGHDQCCRPSKPNRSLADSQSALLCLWASVLANGEDSGFGLAVQPFSPIPLPRLVPFEPTDSSTVPPSAGGLREVCR